MTTRVFLKGEFVVEYVGELLDHKSGIIRDEIYQKNHVLDCFLFFFTHKFKKYCIDATKESDRLGRLINHSRKGLLRPRVIEVERIPRLVFFANRDISIGAEVTYDYGERRKDILEYHKWLI